MFMQHAQSDFKHFAISAERLVFLPHGKKSWVQFPNCVDLSVVSVHVSPNIWMGFPLESLVFLLTNNMHDRSILQQVTTATHVLPQWQRRTS